MKLIYRGVTYDYTPSEARTAAQTEDAAPAVHHSYHLKYRGADYDVDPDEVKRSIFHPIANLMYRGVVYSTNG